MQNTPHTTDEDTKKELQDIKTKFNTHEKKTESGIKALDNKIKDEASKSDLSAQKTLLTGLISTNTKKIKDVASRAWTTSSKARPQRAICWHKRLF